MALRLCSCNAFLLPYFLPRQPSARYSLIQFAREILSRLFFPSLSDPDRRRAEKLATFCANHGDLVTLQEVWGTHLDVLYTAFSSRGYSVSHPPSFSSLASLIRSYIQGDGGLYLAYSPNFQLLETKRVSFSTSESKSRKAIRHALFHVRFPEIKQTPPPHPNWPCVDYLLVTTTHLDALNITMKMQQVREVKQSIGAFVERVVEEYKVNADRIGIVCSGDFNIASSDSGGELYSHLMDSKDVVWRDVLEGTRDATFDPQKNEMVQEESEARRIDYVFVVEKVWCKNKWVNVARLECTQAEIIPWPDECLSDHYPIIASLQPAAMHHDI